jgi:hypothetical protein
MRNLKTAPIGQMTFTGPGCAPGTADIVNISQYIEMNLTHLKAL